MAKVLRFWNQSKLESSIRNQTEILFITNNIHTLWSKWKCGSDSDTLIDSTLWSVRIWAKIYRGCSCRQKLKRKKIKIEHGLLLHLPHWPSLKKGSNLHLLRATVIIMSKIHTVRLNQSAMPMAPPPAPFVFIMCDKFTQLYSSAPSLLFFL